MIGAGSPLRDRQFRMLWFGRCASYLGDGLMPVALPFAVLHVGGDVSDIGLVLGTLALARLLAVIPAGSVVDRWGRRRTILVSDGLQAIAYVGMSVAIASRWGSIVPLLLGSAVAGLASSLFLPLIGALTADLVAADRRQAANSLISGARYSLAAAGAALSGLIVVLGSPALAYSINAATFIASFIFMRRLPDLPSVHSEPSFLTNLRSGIDRFRHTRWYASTSVSHGLFSLFVAPFLVAGPIRLGAAGWATVAVVGTLGAFVGAVVGTQLKVNRPLRASAWLLLAGCAPPLLLGATSSGVAIAVGYGFGMAGQVLTNDLWQTGVQRHVPSELLGRLAAYEWVISLGLAPVGLSLAGPAMSRFGQAEVLIGCSIGIVIVALLTALNPLLRQVEPAGDAELVAPQADAL